MARGKQTCKILKEIRRQIYAVVGEVAYWRLELLPFMRL